MAEKLKRRRVLQLLGVGLATPTVSLLRVDTAYSEQRLDCPIFMFHLTEGAAVESILVQNLQQGRAPITVSDLGQIIRGEKAVPEKPPFCLTFDDGYLIQFSQAVPVLERYHSPATFYVMGTGWRGDGIHAYMSHDQIRQLAEKNFEIGSHTINHDPNLIALRSRSKQAYQAEIFTSKHQLEELIQREVQTFCYPNGVHDQGIIEDVNKAYLAAVSTLEGRTQATANLQRLSRVRVN
jgi:peptidoglycan/xylan/chitin deacetylase (PgdA/CDA1 family)